SLYCGGVVRPAPALRPPTRGGAAVAPAGQTITVIDDDESVRKSLRRLIRSFGLNAEVFASAAEFLARPEGEAPACIVVDVRMPGMGGLELQRRLASLGRRIPIVFITGHEDETA